MQTLAQARAELKVVPASKELTQLRNLRRIVNARDAGLSQREIASLVGVTQPEISRLLKRADLQPGGVSRSPREVLLEYAVHEISHQQMIAELDQWPFTFGAIPADDPAGESYQRGDWDQIEHAGDLLDDADYKHLREVTKAAREAAMNARHRPIAGADARNYGTTQPARGFGTRGARYGQSAPRPASELKPITAITRTRQR